MPSRAIRYAKRFVFVWALFLLTTVNHTIANAEDWTEYSRSEQIAVFWRSVPGSSVPEFKAVGTISASPLVCWSVILDFAEYEKTMPYVRESRIIGQAEDGGVYVYSVIDPGKFLVSPRDFTIKVLSNSGSLTVKWDIARNYGPAVVGEYVRVQQNSGTWTLQPLSNGMGTAITYRVHTDPGGVLGAGSRLLPNSVLAWVNSDALPELYAKLRLAVKLSKYRSE